MLEKNTPNNQVTPTTTNQDGQAPVIPQSTSQNIPQPSGDQSATTQPSTTQQPPTSQQQISGDMASKLKEDITKDVSNSVSDQVSKSLLEKIAGALGLSKKEEEALPTTPNELQALVDKRVQDVFEKQTKEKQLQEAQTKEQQQAKVDTIIKNWHSQYEQMSNIDKVPKIVDANKSDDPGVLARRKIIIKIGEMIDQNRAKGSDYVPSIQDVLMQYPDVISDIPGANLPISGNSAGKSSNGQFKHSEISNKSFAQIARGE